MSTVSFFTVTRDTCTHWSWSAPTPMCISCKLTVIKLMVDMSLLLQFFFLQRMQAKLSKMTKLKEKKNQIAENT